MDFFEIEKVVDHKFVNSGKKREIKLQIKWKGYEDTTWEKFTRFAKDSPEMI